MTRQQLIARAEQLGIAIDIDTAAEAGWSGVRTIAAFAPKGRRFSGTQTHGLVCGELGAGVPAPDSYADAWSDIESNLPLEPCDDTDCDDCCDDDEDE